MPLLDFSDPNLVASSQKYWFYGIALADAGYGANLTLFILCVNLLRDRLSSGRDSTVGMDRTRRRWDTFSLCYTILVFGFATVSIVLEVIVGEKAFVQSWATPAGPSSYLFDSVFEHITTLRPAYAAFISSHSFAAVLLTWRCLILYRAPLGRSFVCHFVSMRAAVMVLPVFLLFISIGTGVIFIIDAITPWKLPPILNGLPWIVIWGSITVVLLWTLTGLIVVRLLTYRWITRKALGKQQHIKYIGLVVIFVESAGLLSLFSVFFIVVLSLRSPALVMVPFMLTQVQALSSLLIIYQITSGKAWSEDVTQTLPMPAFASTSAGPGGGPAGCEKKLDDGEVDGIETHACSVAGDAAING